MELGNEELLGYILNGTSEERRNRIEPLLPAWIKESSKFKEFIDNDRHRNKIKSNLTECPSDEKAFTDKPWFEIIVIFQFFRNFGDLVSQIIYEERKSGPDIKVLLRDDHSFYAEIKRIRPYPVEVAYQHLIEFLNGQQLSFNRSQNIIGLDLTCQIRLNSQDFRDKNLADRLENNDWRTRLIAFLKERLKEIERTGLFNCSGYIFENDIIIEFSWSRNSTGCILFQSGALPFFDYSTQKILSDIESKAKQIVPAEKNLIVLGTDEECFDELHFRQAVKGMKGCNKCINGVLFKCWGSSWHYWCNDQSAKPFPDDVQNILKNFVSSN